ncbi:AI-2E family transporter [Pseudoclavibacter endophyticus]|uniref:AI-2E family transporter n=2 Tax=Pseudoclavibacter endophyticus TaxID=1778590 RepID=A0A6H9WQN7_9MICO|nr:AI-2E family transporter [Pseudoclavibacter endophyticus]
MWTDALGRAATRSLQVLLVVGLAALLIWGSLQISIVVIPVLLALIIASAATPVVTKLRDWGWPSSLATIVVLLAVVLLLGGAIWMIVVLIENQWATLSENAVDGFHQTLSWVESTFGLVVDAEQLGEWYEQVRDFVFSSQFGSAAATGVTAGISAVATFATSAVLFVVVLFFFMKDGPIIWNFLLRPAKGARLRRFKLMGGRAVSVMGGYVRGTVIVALVDAVFIGIGLWVIGVPLAFPLAVIIFICAFIPIVGATLAGIIAALVTLVTNGMWEAIAVIAIVVVVNQLEGNFLQPIVLGRSLKLHALVVLIALMVGTVLGGIVGTLLAVPIAAVGWALIVAWNEPLPQLEHATTKGWFGRDPDERGRRGGRTGATDAEAMSASQPRLPEVARPGDGDAR